MRDGQHQNARFDGFLGRAQCRDNRTGTVFLTLFPARQMLAMPEIDVTNNKAGNRYGRRHAALFQFGVEGGEFVRHLGVAHGFDPLFREILGKANPPIAPLEPGIFLGR